MRRCIHSVPHVQTELKKKKKEICAHNCKDEVAQVAFSNIINHNKKNMSARELNQTWQIEERN